MADFDFKAASESMMDFIKKVETEIGPRLPGSDDSVIVEAACADEKVKRLMEDKKLVKTIVVKNKLINLIIK